MAEARRLLEKAIMHQQAALHIDSKHSEHREFLSNHYELLTTVLESLRESAQALEAARQTVIHREKLATDFPQVPRYRFWWAASQYNLATLLTVRRQYPEAETIYRKTLEV